MKGKISRLLFLLLTLSLLLISCSNKEKKNWEFLFHSNYLSDECFAFFDDPISSKRGVLFFENPNDFPICVYLYKDFFYGNIEKKIMVDAKSTVSYKIKNDKTYYVGIKVYEEIGAFTQIGLSVYCE